ncbi:MAG TPA: hypothetical protein VGP57_20810 [Actinoplanes sp.]|nr:hypothetical protein [Actinoplanes sp.]
MAVGPVRIGERNEPALADPGEHRQRAGEGTDQTGQRRAALAVQQPRTDVGHDCGQGGQRTSEQRQLADPARRVEPQQLRLLDGLPADPRVVEQGPGVVGTHLGVEADVADRLERRGQHDGDLLGTAETELLGERRDDFDVGGEQRPDGARVAALTGGTPRRDRCLGTLFGHPPRMSPNGCAGIPPGTASAYGDWGIAVSTVSGSALRVVPAAYDRAAPLRPRA